MGWFDRRPAVPAEVRREATELGDPGARLLAAATTADGSWLVATDRALWVPRRAVRHRIGWEQVDTASWDRESEILTVLQAAPLGERPRRWTFRLDDPGDLLLVVRERVNATVVLARTVRIGEASVRVVARRAPGQDELSWVVSAGRGLDVSDPSVHGRLQLEVARLRSELGG